MKTQLTEVQKLQKIAGILNEAVGTTVQIETDPKKIRQLTRDKEIKMDCTLVYQPKGSNAGATFLALAYGEKDQYKRSKALRTWLTKKLGDDPGGKGYRFVEYVDGYENELEL